MIEIILSPNTTFMRLKIMLSSIFVAAIFVLASSFSTQPVSTNNAGDWFFLEDKKVGFGVDHDVIHFGNWKDDVRQIKIQVTEGPLRMYDMKIHFDNGAVQTVSLRSRFAQGGESRVIDMDGGLRHLTKIEFWYETKGFSRGRSKVNVYGRN